MGTPISRRSFLELGVSAGVVGAVAAAAGTRALAGPAGRPRPGPDWVPTTTERHRVVIIGSGFGGAIAAWRLAQAGVDAVVLERGRRWPVDPAGTTFPRFLSPDRRSSYLTPTPVFPGQPPVVYRPYTGLYERVRGRGMDVLNGACVGGGSVVYAGAWVRPDERWFTEVMPASVTWDEMRRVYYPRAAARAGVSPIPDDILAHERYAGGRLYLEQAARAGLPVRRVPVAADWDIARAELAGRVPAALTVGEYLSGVNSGARLSLDRTYLGWAERSGRTTVRPLHTVVDLATDDAGRYVVRCDRIDTDGIVVEHKVLVADAVFLGAGSTGTTTLLLRARENGALPRLNEHIGRHWGNNGDRVVLRTGIPEPTGAHQGGPMCLSILDWDNPLGPVTVEYGAAPFPQETHSMAVPSFALCEPAGRFEYSGVTDRVELVWPADGDLAGQRAIRSTLERLVAATGGVPFGTTAGAGLAGSLGAAADRLTAAAPDAGGAGGLAGLAAGLPAGLVDVNGVTPVTFHPLGGAVIDRACDSHGRVHGYPGLYVTDGALVPGSTAACNPVWTISALAERAMDDIVTRDVGATF